MELHYIPVASARIPVGDFVTAMNSYHPPDHSVACEDSHAAFVYKARQDDRGIPDDAQTKQLDRIATRHGWERRPDA